MHRHGYKGKKLGRKRDERRTLVKNMTTSLILDESITTTLPKAKELVPYAEKLISKARKGGLHNRRQVVSGVLRDDAASKLVDEIAPKINRNSGYLRLERAGTRRGDRAEMARVSFVDDVAVQEVKKAKSDSKAKAASNKQKEAKPTSAKSTDSAKKTSTKQSPVKKPAAKEKTK